MLESGSKRGSDFIPFLSECNQVWFDWLGVGSWTLVTTSTFCHNTALEASIMVYKFIPPVNMQWMESPHYHWKVHECTLKPSAQYMLCPQMPINVKIALGRVLEVTMKVLSGSYTNPGYGCPYRMGVHLVMALWERLYNKRKNKIRSVLETNQNKIIIFNLETDRLWGDMI